MAKGERGTAKPYLRGKIWWIRYSVPGEGRRQKLLMSGEVEVVMLWRDKA